MDVTHLTGTAPVKTPEPALAMYAAEPKLAMAEKPERIPYDRALGDRILRQFLDLSARSAFTGKPDKVWNNGIPFIAGDGKPAWRINCNDFAPMLVLRLMAVRIPRGALRLVHCSFDGDGHMVTAIDCQEGTLIACNLQGIWDWPDPAWDYHEWHKWEGHRPGPEGWESLQPVGLDVAIDAARRAGEVGGEAGDV